MPLPVRGLQDLVLQLGKDLPAQRIDSAYWKENIIVHLYFKRRKSKKTVPGPAESASESFFCHGTCGRGLHDGACDICADIPGEHCGHACRFACAEDGFSRDGAGGESAQILFADFLLEGGIGAGITRFSYCHKIPAVFRVIIARPQFCPDIEAFQSVKVCLFHCPGSRSPCLCPGIIAVNVFSVDRRDARGIDRLFHPALDLEGINSGVDQFGKDLQYAHILHGEGIDLFFAGIGTGRLSVFIQDPVVKSAGSSAAPPVAASSSKKTGHQASAGIGVAHCSVDKSLDLDRPVICGRIFRPEYLHFSQRQFPCGNDTAHAQAAQIADSLR